MNERLPPLILGKNEDRRLRAGHLWIYANEIDKTKSPLKSFAPGDPVDVLGANGKWMARGYVNPGALIAARILTRTSRQTIDAGFIESRLTDALNLRERFFKQPFYRLVYGESDRLPGLVIDRYDETFVVQTNSAGMDRMTDTVVECLVNLFSPKSIVLRNDSSARSLEGLEQKKEVVYGEAPERVEIEEDGVRFEVDVLGGQKTGWYFDQSENRRWLKPFVDGASMLDVCSYVGAWSMHGLTSGASVAHCVDSSEAALDRARAHAELNGVSESLKTHAGDAFDVLKALAADRQSFDVVVVDPPAFIRRKKSVRDGLSAYQRLNASAIKLLKRDGLLVTSSCSYHANRDEFRNAIRRAGIAEGRHLQLIREGYQASDHPIHPAMPETQYLKCLVFRVL